MQSDPNTIDLNTYTNRFSAADRPHFEPDNNYPSSQKPPSPPPSYSQISASSTGYTAPGVYYHGQTSLYPQERVVIMPTYRPLWMDKVSTMITPDLRIFFIMTGIIYFIWSLTAMSLEVALIVKSRSVIYSGLWAGSVILGGGIYLLTIAFRTSYPMIYLLRFLVFVLFFCALGFVLCAIYYSSSPRCSSVFGNKYPCDKEIVTILKITILVLFILVTFHTIAIIIVINKMHKKSLLASITAQIDIR